MRIRVRHRLGYVFADPARNITRILRLTPRSFEGQHVVNWQVDVDVDCVLKAGEDGFGNLTHTFTAKGPCDKLTVSVTGEIENFDAAGIVRGAVERMPLELYTRETSLTAADDKLRVFARKATDGSDSLLGKLHALMGAVHETVGFEAARPAAAHAAAAFAAKRGNGEDLAHIFTACARQIGGRARVASGYFLCPDQQRGMSHTWSEVMVDGLGWTAFDPAHDLCPQERHVRLATGLDFLGAAPVRGVAGETVHETLDMSAVMSAGWTGGQGQSQGPGWQRQSQGGQSQSQG